MSEDEKKAWNPATADQIENVIRHSGGDSIIASHAITYCRLISQRANANWSIEAVQHVVDIATTHPQPRVGESIVSTGKRDSVEMLEADAINGDHIYRERSPNGKYVAMRLITHQRPQGVSDHENKPVPRAYTR